MKSIGLQGTAAATLAWLLVTATTSLSETSSAAADLPQVTAVAEGFYAAYSTFHPSDGIPDAKGRAKYEPLISPALNDVLKQGEMAERHFAATTKNMSPPLIEGDLFTSNFEGATSYHVGQCNIGASEAHCTVAFGYHGGKEDSKPVNWADTVYLVHTDAGWKLDDVAYGGTWAFGNKGRLKQTLQAAIHNGNDAAQ